MTQITTEKLSAKELAIIKAVELKQYLKEKYNIEPAAGGMVTTADRVFGTASSSFEFTGFDVILEPGFDAAKKISIIKVVRELTGQGLAEAKALVESVPRPIREGVDRLIAEDCKKQLEDVGAKISIKPKRDTEKVTIQNSPVQQFLEDVISSPFPPTIDLNSQRIHFVVRPIATTSSDEPWTDARNHRRCDLIDKEIEGTISPAEAVELEELQNQMRRHVNKVAPLPLAGARRLHAELLAKASLAVQS